MPTEHGSLQLELIKRPRYSFDVKSGTLSTAQKDALEQCLADARTAATCYISSLRQGEFREDLLDPLRENSLEGSDNPLRSLFEGDQKEVFALIAETFAVELANTGYGPFMAGEMRELAKAYRTNGSASSASVEKGSEDPSSL